MIPSRGLRWSSQTIGIGRRRVEPFSARQFSSNRPIRTNPLICAKTSAFTTLPRANATFPSSSTSIWRGASLRFASTTPSGPVIPTTITPGTAPIDAVSSSAAPLTTSFDAATDLTSDSLYNVPEHIGYLKSLGLDYGIGPTGGIEWLLEHVHILAGTPWWVSITLTAFVVRAVLFKPYMDAAENGARMATIMPLTKPVTEKMKAAAALGDSQTALQLRSELQRINARAGIKLWKSFVPMVQIFAGYGTFVLLRAMSNLPVPGFETGGALWFQNLALPDPFFLFPFATATVLHWVLRQGGEMGVNTMAPEMQKAMMWGFPMLTILFTWWLPAALQLSFFVSGVLSAAQATLFRKAWFRHRFGMTPLPTKPSKTDAPVSAYKGTLKRVASPGPLSTTELGNRFEGPKAGLQKTVGQIRDMQPPAQSKLKEILGAPISGIKGTIDSIKDAGKGAVDMTKERMAKNKEKSAINERKAYEAKRQEELKKERWERENQQRAERAARRAMKDKEQ